MVLKFEANRERILGTAPLTKELGLSLGEVSSATRRATAAQLLVPHGLAPTKGRPIKRLLVNRASLLEFLIHGVRYVFVPDRGKLARGTPTLHAAPPLDAVIKQAAGPPSVWPNARGEVRGESFSPLHPAAVVAARNDPELYALLVLVDALRGGSAREREVGAALLVKRLAGERSDE